MRVEVLYSIIAQDIAVNHREDGTAVRIRLHYDIGSDSASVIDRTPALRPELLFKRVRDGSHTAVLIAVAVVYGLNTTAARAPATISEDDAEPELTITIKGIRVSTGAVSVLYSK